MISRRISTAPQVFVNPGDPQHRQYVLEQWTSDEMQRLMKLDPASTPIAYEAGEDPNARVNVAFLDGHVELFMHRQALLDQLAKSRAELKQ